MLVSAGMAKSSIAVGEISKAWYPHSFEAYSKKAKSTVEARNPARFCCGRALMELKVRYLRQTLVIRTLVSLKIHGSDPEGIPPENNAQAV